MRCFYSSPERADGSLGASICALGTSEKSHTRSQPRARETSLRAREARAAGRVSAGGERDGVRARGARFHQHASPVSHGR